MPTRSGRKSLAQTPSPRSERIYGSKKNPKGSASSEKTASKITLNDSIISALKDKLSQFKEENPNSSNITLNDLKAVYRRGLGAYSSSHRPTITGGKPNTRNAWAMARVNKFLKKASGEKVKKAYIQDDDLMKYGGIITDNKGKKIKIKFSSHQRNKEVIDVYASVERSGVLEKISTLILSKKKIRNLFEYEKFLSEQGFNEYFLIDTASTKSEFQRKGVYEKILFYILKEYQIPIISSNYPERTFEASKFWKKLKSKNSNVFHINQDFILMPKKDDDLIKMHLGGDMSKHLAPNGKPSNLTHEQWHLVRTPEFKAWFGDWENDPENASKVIDENGEPLIVYHTSNNEFYVFDKKKSKGGFYFSANKERLSVYGKSKLNQYFLNIKNPTEDEFSIKGFDGVMDFGQMKIRNAKFLYEIICFSSNQIKLADGTNTTFDSSNPDIRFDNGGEVEDLIGKGEVELKIYKTTPEHAKQYGLDSINPLYVQSIYISEDKRLIGIGKKVLEYIEQYAIKNGNDVVFGHITQKAEFSKDKRETVYNDIDLIKNWLHSKGYAINSYNNDFYKVISSSNPKYDGGGITQMHLGGDMSKHLAPNGKPSNLTHEQWHLVRTPEFKAWFGDWENDPENASKVVDENGEPLVVYHGSPKNFTIFKSGIYWFSNQPRISKEYGNKLYACFLNVKNPFQISPLGGYEFKKNKEDEGGYYDNLPTNINWVVKNPNQIKLADGSNTTFDSMSNDIRYNKGGAIKQYLQTIDDLGNSDYDSLGEAMMKKGGVVLNEDQKEDYNRWKSLVNMSKSELEKFYYSEEGRKAGLSREEAKAQGISSGRESAKWIMKMKQTPVSYWTDEMWRWANKQISFISRMSGAKGKLYDEKGNKTRKHLALLIWGHNPEKKENGGEIILSGGLSENISDEELALMKDLSIEELYKLIDEGMQVEEEHTDNPLAQKKIAKDHIIEDIDYYKKLNTIEKNYTSYPYTLWISSGINWEGIAFTSLEEAISHVKQMIDSKKEPKQYAIYETDTDNVLLNQNKIKNLIINNLEISDYLPNYHINKGINSNNDILNLPDSTASANNLNRILMEQGYELRKISNSTKIQENQSVMNNNETEKSEPYTLYVEDLLKDVKNKISTINSDSSSSRISKMATLDAYYERSLDKLKSSKNQLDMSVWETISSMWEKEISNMRKCAKKMAKGGITDCGCGQKETYAKGGLAYGNSHNKGGIPLKVKDTGQNIEIEGGEGVVNKKTMQMGNKYNFNGKMMTPCEIISSLNETGGGVKFQCRDVHKIIDNDGTFD